MNVEQKEKLWTLIEEYREANADLVYETTIDTYANPQNTTEIQKNVDLIREELKVFIDSLTK